MAPPPISLAISFWAPTDVLPRPAKIFLSAGEASGEYYGSLLIEALRKLHPDAIFFGLGGQRMEALGCRLIVRSEDVAVMGITEVVRHMPRLYREYRKLKRSLREQAPDIAVLIDFPDINLKLAAELHRLGIPVIFFVSPQLWAWKKQRIRLVQRFVTRMLVIFPFEEAFYRERGVDATYVGHPLADLPLPSISRQDFAALYALDPSKTWVGLLPGSRDKEIRLNLPIMAASASELGAASASQPGGLPGFGSGYEFLLPLAPTLTVAHVVRVRRMLASLAPTARITLVSDARAVLHHARASIVASGTATVEAALIGNPFIVVYRVSRITYAVAKRVVKVPFVAMVNLIAGRAIVPELIQDDFNLGNVVSQMRTLLSDVPESEMARQTMKNELTRVQELLRAGQIPPTHSEPDQVSAPKTAADRVASIASTLLHELFAGQSLEESHPASTSSAR